MTLDDEVTPVWPVRLPRLGWDRLARRRDGRLERLIHVGGHPVLLRAWHAGRNVRLRAESRDAAAAEAGMARARFWTGSTMTCGRSPTDSAPTPSSARRSARRPTCAPTGGPCRSRP